MGKFAPTDEQQAIVNIAQSGISLKVMAYAGTGKTTTLALIAKALTSGSKRGLYLAFNKSIATSAGKAFDGTNTTARTFHSLAYRDVGFQFQERFSRITPAIISNALGCGNSEAFDALMTVKKYCQSTSKSILPRHVEGACTRKYRETVWNHANKLWDLMSDIHGDFPSMHDIYLKLWVLSEPTINADVVFFDEAQDADPLMRYLIEKQQEKGVQVIWVGDPHQQLYEFRGAIDALEHVKTDKTAYLTKSFRFGKEVAAVANGVLKELGADHKNLMKGLGQTGVVQVNVSKKITTEGVLCRSNAEVMGNLLDLPKTERVAITGHQDWKNFLYAYRSLGAGRSPHNGAFSLFSSLNELSEYCETDEGSDVKPYLDLVKSHGASAIEAALERAAQFTGKPYNGVVISTVHRAKGLEWNSVMLGDDFIFPGCEKLEGKSPKETGKIDMEAELRVVYVAITRGKTKVIMPPDLLAFCESRPVDKPKEESVGNKAHLHFGLDF